MRHKKPEEMKIGYCCGFDLDQNLCFDPGHFRETAWKTPTRSGGHPYQPLSQSLRESGRVQNSILYYFNKNYVQTSAL